MKMERKSVPTEKWPMSTLMHSIIALSFFLAGTPIVTAQTRPVDPWPPGGSGGGTANPRPATPSTGSGGRITAPYSRGVAAITIGYIRTSVRGIRLAVPTGSARMARINLRGGGRILITTGGGTVGIGGGPGPTPPQSPGGGGPIAVGIPALGPRR